jgi:transposase
MTALDRVDAAANDYRVSQAALERDRDRLAAACKAAAAAGHSEYQIAGVAGVTRQTVRVWLGKGRP